MVNLIKLSVIIPVYNVEKYIKRNIDSLVALKDSNIELIYIDDGSPDQSVSIIEKYRKNDNRIKLLRQKNGGLSAARNAGIDIAKGEWILFVDGDDWVDAKQLEKLLEEASDECEIVWGKLKSVSENQVPERSENKDVDIRYQIKSGVEWLTQGVIDYTACVYLYRSHFLEKKRLNFPVGLLHEDMEFIPKVFCLANYVKKTDINFYRYVERVGSISNTKNIKRSKDLILIAQNLHSFFDNGTEEIIRYGQGYTAFLCEASLHLAILHDLDWENVFENKEEKMKVISFLLAGNRVRDKVAGHLIKRKQYKIYKTLYLCYNKVRNFLKLLSEVR